MSDEKGVNVVSIVCQKIAESAFEKHIIFKNADDDNIEGQSEIWWQFDKRLISETPQFLSFPPESLLLLK